MPPAATPGLSAEELAAWLRLTAIGRVAARRLLGAHSSAEAVVSAPPRQLAEVVGTEAATRLTQPTTAEQTALFDATTAWLAGPCADGCERAVLPLGDPRYPPLLLDAADPPLLLYAHGRIALLQSPCLAIVGSRNPTPQGAENARAFAAFLGGQGWTIVSGLALGIDGAAHTGALEAGAATIAVVGTGLDRVYPKRHQSLAHRIVAGGLMLGELPIGTPPLPAHFPQRNRLIAGLSRGTLVVEAALQSGSLITARLASEAGREVFAIPGSIHAPQARGCHALIKQGAQLVESGADVLDQLPALATAAAPAPHSPPAAPDAAHPLLDAMGHDPIGLDALGDRTGWPAAALSSQLLELELEGRVARLPGQLFQRMSRV